MKIRLVIITLISVVMILPFVTSCRRSDQKTAVIDVPKLSSDLDVRIVTNAALDTVVAHYDGIPNTLEIDLQKGVILYHESQRLLSSAYRQRIEARIAEVGYNAKIIYAKHNPPALLDTSEGPVQDWPNRFTAAIRVTGMNTQKDANIIADAIAYARLGGDDSRIQLDKEQRNVRVHFEGLLLSVQNIEHAIASVGYTANDTPACLGRDDAVPDGWRHISL